VLSVNAPFRSVTYEGAIEVLIKHRRNVQYAYIPVQKQQEYFSTTAVQQKELAFHPEEELHDHNGAKCPPKFHVIILTQPASSPGQRHRPGFNALRNWQLSSINDW